MFNFLEKSYYVHFLLLIFFLFYQFFHAQHFQGCSISIWGTERYEIIVEAVHLHLICQNAKIYIFPNTSKLLCCFFDFRFRKRVFKKLVTHHPKRCKLLWHWGLQRQFTLYHSSPDSSPKSSYLIENVDIIRAIYPLSTRHPEKGDEWIELATSSISEWYVMWGWWVGDE